MPLEDRRNTPNPGFTVPGAEPTPGPAPKGFLGLLNKVTSGESFINTLSNDYLSAIPGWGQGRNSGTRIINEVKRLPFVGGLAAFLADAAMSPLTLATAGFGGPAAAGLKTLGPAGRVAAGFVSPIAKAGGFGTRVAAETAVAGVGKVGSDAAGEVADYFTDDEKYITAAKLVGGLGGGMYAAKSLGNFQDVYARDAATRSGLDGSRRKLLEGITKAVRPEGKLAAWPEPKGSPRQGRVAQDPIRVPLGERGPLTGPGMGQGALDLDAVRQMDLPETPGWGQGRFGGGRVSPDVMEGARGTGYGFPQQPLDMPVQPAFAGMGPNAADPKPGPGLLKDDIGVKQARLDGGFDAVSPRDPTTVPGPGTAQAEMGLFQPDPWATDARARGMVQGEFGGGSVPLGAAGDNAGMPLRPDGTPFTQAEMKMFGAEPSLLPDDIQELHQFIADYKPFQDAMQTGAGDAERLRATGALNALLTGENVTPKDLQLLGRALGMQLETKNLTFGSKLHDVLNMPRSIISSIDLSAPFQQGGKAISRKEWWTAWGPMLRAALSEKNAVATEHQIFTRPLAEVGHKAQLYLARLSEGGPGAQDEAFRTSLAESLPLIGPLIQRSGAAYITFLNKLRADLFDGFVERAIRSGKPLTDVEMAERARWINTITGRGNLAEGGAIGKMTNDFGSLLFAPKYLWSNVEFLSPSTYLKMSPEMRMEAARDFAGFAAMGTAALGLIAASAKAAKAAGLIEDDVHFSEDPRSADFGQIRIGQVRYDPWGGLRPLVRYGAQFLSGQRKTSGGDLRDVDSLDVLGRFLRSKLNPAVGAAVDATRGETFMGETFDLSTSGGVGDQTIQRMTPLLLQTLAEAFMAEGAKGLLKAAPAAVGFGTQVYGDYGQVRNDFAMRDLNLPWDRLTATQKGTIERDHAEELAKVDTEAKEGEYRFAQLRIDDGTRKAEEALNRDLDNDVIDIRTFNAMISDVSKARRVAVKETRLAMGLKDDPTDVISRYMALQTDPGVSSESGVVDWAILDQRQEDFKNSLADPQERAIVEDFSRFEHHDSVRWYFDAKKTLRESGYWNIETEEFQKQKSAVDRLYPGLESHTQLERAARAAQNEGRRVEAIRLNSILSRINSRVKDRRERLRRNNAAVDAAGHAVYAMKPLNMQNITAARRGLLTRG